MSSATSGPRAAQERERDPGKASIGALVSGITRDTSTLVRQEIELAKAEAKAAGMFAAAAIGGFLVVLFLSHAVWWGLANVIDQGWAALIVAVLWALVAAVLVTIARQRTRHLKALPQTSATVRRTPEAVMGDGDHRSGGHR